MISGGTMEKDFMLQLTYDDLYAFHMRNILRGGTGKFCFTIAIVGMIFGGYQLATHHTTSGIACIVAGLLIILSVPRMLRKYAEKNLVNNPLLDMQLHYKIVEEGFGIIYDQLPEEERPQGVYPWSLAQQIRVADDMIAVFVNHQNVHLFPFRELGEDKDWILEAIKARVPEARIKGKV